MNYKQKRQAKKLFKWVAIVAGIILVIRFIRKQAKKGTDPAATETH